MKRKRNHSRKRRLRALLGCLLGSIVLLGAAQINYSRVLYHLSPKVRQVTFTGHEGLNTHLLDELTNIRPGEALFWLPTAQILSRLRSYPPIDDAALNRRFNGTVEVSLRQRQPALIVASEQLLYADHRGFIYQSLEQSDSRNYIVITGVVGNPALDGLERQKLLQAALDLIDKSQQLFITKTHTVSEIHIDSSEGFSLFTDRIGGKVVVGLPPFDKKVERLAAILNRLEGRLFDIEFVDLDYNSRAFVRMKHQGQKILAKKGW